MTTNGHHCKNGVADIPGIYGKIALKTNSEFMYGIINCDAQEATTKLDLWKC